jgi:hypothetical protein
MSATTTTRCWSFLSPVSYNGGPWLFGVQLLEFRGDKVARERIYGGEGWEAPEWRAPWRSNTPADPPE